MIDLAPATGSLVMGLAGSMHCAAMCGAIFGACAQGGPGKGSGVAATLALHAGRLVSYSALGALCGAAGAVVDWGAGALSLPRLAAIVSGVVMIGLALDQLGAARWVRATFVRGPASTGAPVPVPGGGFFQRVLGRALHSPGKSGLFAVGAALGILPCGLLYGAAALAAATADPLNGASLMALFALGGAVPLVGLGQVFRWLWTRGAGTWISRAAAVIVLLLGIGAMTGRVGGNPVLAGHEHHLHTGSPGPAGHAHHASPVPKPDPAVTGAPEMQHDGHGKGHGEHEGHSH